MIIKNCCRNLCSSTISFFFSFDKVVFSRHNNLELTVERFWYAFKDWSAVSVRKLRAEKKINEHNLKTKKIPRNRKRLRAKIVHCVLTFIVTWKKFRLSLSSTFHSPYLTRRFTRHRVSTRVSMYGYGDKTHTWSA